MVQRGAINANKLRDVPCSQPLEAVFRNGLERSFDGAPCVGVTSPTPISLLSELPGVPRERSETAQSMATRRVPLFRHYRHSRRAKLFAAVRVQTRGGK
jgi:hypothetical protein